MALSVAEMDDRKDEAAEILLPQEMLSQFDQVNVCGEFQLNTRKLEAKLMKSRSFPAPMVRYSKLPFRQLVSLYDCQITHTPMMLVCHRILRRIHQTDSMRIRRKSSPVLRSLVIQISRLIYKSEGHSTCRRRHPASSLSNSTIRSNGERKRREEVARSEDRSSYSLLRTTVCNSRTLLSSSSPGWTGLI